MDILLANTSRIVSRKNHEEVGYPSLPVIPPFVLNCGLVHDIIAITAQPTRRNNWTNDSSATAPPDGETEPWYPWCGIDGQRPSCLGTIRSAHSRWEQVGNPAQIGEWKLDRHRFHLDDLLYKLLVQSNERFHRNFRM